MIAALAGRLTEKAPSRVVVDVQGVGYEVHVPLSTFYELGDPGTEVALRIHTHVREDALALFGFASAIELQLFEHLISVSGIGPRLALTALSGIEPPELVRAVRQADVARLTGIPGVGKKTAERMVLELKDRLPAAEGADHSSESAEVAESEDLHGDVLSALLNLGYHRPLAERAIDAALRASADRGFEQVLRQALRELAR
ncbi:MAG: Holliday junction branch migration protein RuvA [Vicinamibacterales bacterium]|nr:Holliday junction branch migration protein RuvA [Acidobacteriota bacterium]MDP7293758.1 Holliday junction branch migration protein RuvA [Vicinamibacterales bacterium]MDP7472982.1 Holliday junction branch migration protein RuvA [Vicinamibacterales bacterium]MDP7672335.1 Holliday junction branch migration protein RuvA [Vicinamibacterales bacterium]HJO39992.1 Holliday junction branch migration protein RuvA [Vicinamibacterales bacterium]